MSCGYIINQLACTAVDAGWQLFDNENHPELPETNPLQIEDEYNCYIYVNANSNVLPSGIAYRQTTITEKCKYTFTFANLFVYGEEAPPPYVAGTIQLLGYNGDVTNANDYDILATYELPNLDGILNTTTFSFTAEQSYDGFAFNVINTENGELQIFSFQLEQYCCDETTNETSNQYLITQDQVDAAIEKAKCCYGKLKSKQLQRLKDGLEVCEETNKNLTLLDMSIFVLSRYCKGGCNCIGDNDAYYKIEVINNICGCANC